MTKWFISLVALGLVGATGCSGPTEGPARGEAMFASCTSCHGTDGRGNPKVATPSIAGLPAWYVEAQLIKFRDGARGDHPDDTDGLRMRPMARTLTRESDVKALADYVAGLSAARPAPTLTGGDAERGKALYGPCTACHQVDGGGNQALNAPPLTLASDWYLLAQLRKFKGGLRGADPQDATGATMVPFAMTLTDEQAMKDVIAYIGTLGQ